MPHKMQKEKEGSWSNTECGEIEVSRRRKRTYTSNSPPHPPSLPLPFSSFLPSAHLFLSFLLFSPCQVGRLEPSGLRQWKIQPREEAAMCLAEPHEVSRGASGM